MLEKFNMKDCKATNIPMNLGCQLSRDSGTPKIDPHLYRSIVESLIWVSMVTRPDICLVVSRYMSNPEHAHLLGAKQILKFLNELLNMDFTYHLMKMMGYIHSVMQIGGEILILKGVHPTSFTNWETLQLNGVASYNQQYSYQPHTKAEYRILSDVAKDIIHLKKLLQELEIMQVE